MIELGREYKDKITGFKGICTGKVQYISGCDQALLSPAAGKDGSLRGAEWFDVQRLDVVGEKRILLKNDKTPGFDAPAPKK